VPIGVTGLRLDSLAVARTTITAPVSVTGVSSASPTVCMTLPNALYECNNVLLLVQPASLTIGTTNISVECKVDGVFQTTLTPTLAASIAFPTVLGAIFSITNANHQITVTAFVNAGTGTFGAGAGTTGAAPVAWAAAIPI
jgi:hypothetical protein